MSLRLFAAVVFFITGALARGAQDAEVLRAALLAGVQRIAAPGAPGAVCAFGPAAVVLIAGKEGKAASLPVVAASPWEKGRIVAFGHNGYLAAVAEYDTGRLLLNAARWAGAGTAKPKIGVLRQVALAGHLESGGLSVQQLSGADWSSRLSGLDVVVVDAHALVEKDVEPLARFIRAGGGLITAATGWGWIYTHPGRSLTTDFPGNQLLAQSGVMFADGTPDPTFERGFEVGVTLPLLNASLAAEALEAHATKPQPAAELGQAGVTLAHALRTVPGTDSVLRPRLKRLLATANAGRLPTQAEPLKAADAVARLALTEEIERLRSAPAREIRAHPAAASFPGTVAADAPRLGARKLVIDARVPGWHGTGLYAAPGEIIHVQIPLAAAERRLAVRIGCHTDTLWHLETWKRVPEITRRELLNAADTATASAFGGLIYIDVPEQAAAVGSFEVTITGAVAAPRFVLGKTTLEDWKRQLRHEPAPWAELETSRMILSVPSEKIRALDDPAALLQLWDRVLDAVADLATIPRERARPERIVPDVQISAGYMHSGYPIMTWLDHSVDTSLQVELLRAGSWGHFHELGHNHQAPDWTFAGTTEVTCNLFSLYVTETVCGLPPGSGHDALKPEAVAARLRRHLQSRASFERWKSDPFLALTMYDQLRAAFGWEAYQKVFAAYRALPKEQRPKNDDEKRDQWLVRFSRAVGKNLGPFFVAWGVPTTETARASIRDLPEWMPADWPR